MQPERHALRSPLQCKARGSRLPMRCVWLCPMCRVAERGCKSLFHAGWEETCKVMSFPHLLVARTQNPPGPFAFASLGGPKLCWHSWGLGRSSGLSAWKGQPCESTTRPWQEAPRGSLPSQEGQAGGLQDSWPDLNSAGRQKEHSRPRGGEGGGGERLDDADQHCGYPRPTSCWCRCWCCSASPQGSKDVAPLPQGEAHPQLWDGCRRDCGEKQVIERCCEWVKSCWE